MIGIGSLFSVEFFRECVSHLTDEGLMVQWVQAYEMDEETFKVIARTFCSVFPEASIWKVTATQDVLLLGSKRKIMPDFIECEKRLNQNPIKEELSRINLYDLFTLLGMQLASNENIRNYIADKDTVNSDYKPLLEYKAPLALYTKSSINDLLSGMDERKAALENSGLLMKDYVRLRRMDYNNLKNLYLNLIQEKENNTLLSSLVAKWYRDFPEDKEAKFAYFSTPLAGIENSVLELEKLIRKDKNFDYLDIYASSLVKRYRLLNSFLAPEVLPDTVERLNLCASLSENNKAKFYYLSGNVFLENRNYKDSLVYYSKVEESVKSEKEARLQNISYSQLLNNMYFAYLNEGQLEKASEYEKKSSLLFPQ